MRLALLAFVSISATTSAYAATPPSRATVEAQAAAKKLNNPQVQRIASDTIGAMLAALLDVRLDGIAKAFEPMNGGKKIALHGRTLREIAERDDPNFTDKMHDGTRTAIVGAGALASALAVAMPEIEAALAKMGDAVDKAKERLPDG